MKSIYPVLPVLVVLTFHFIFTGHENPAQFNIKPAGNELHDVLIPMWSNGANMPTFCINAGSFSFIRNDTGWVYIVGGDLTGAGVITAKNDMYNVRTNAWSTRSPYPTAPGIWYTDGATLGNFGYICGGLTGTTLSTTTAQLTRYDINANSWQVMAPMPGSRAMGQIEGYQDSLLYYVAGFSSDGSGTALSTVYLYNSISNTWRTATSLPGTRLGGAMAIVGDTIVWVGGITPSFVSGTIQKVPYRGIISQSNRANITWSTGTIYPGTAGYKQRAETWSCKGIVVSGGTGGTTGVNECYLYSPGNNTWVIMPPLITARTSHMTGVVKMQSNIWKFVNVCGVNTSNVLTTDILTDTIFCIPLVGVVTICKYNPGSTKPIPDLGTCIDTISVTLNPNQYTVDVNIRLDTIIHTFDADMDISLSHGSITNLDLSSDNGGSGQDYIGCVLDDQAATSITTAVAPMTGSWRPEASMTVWNGTSPNGLWRLQITDDLGGDSGYLRQWCVTINYDLTGTNNNNESIPENYSLMQNYPNPFNPSTRITYLLPNAGIVKLVVHDILGREVITLQNGFKPAGTHIIEFNAADFSSGVYFYHIEAGKFTDAKKMLLIK
jgi:subtilisin-like proprotein convertase family protein